MRARPVPSVRAAALATLACVFAGCVAGGEDIRTLARGGVSGIHDALRIVITNDANWTTFWAGHVAGVGGGARPDVDFAKERVVAVFLGQKPDACWSVEITKARTDNVAQTTTVTYAEKHAAAACTQQITYPHQIAAIPRAGTEITFERE